MGDLASSRNIKIRMLSWAQTVIMYHLENCKDNLYRIENIVGNIVNDRFDVDETWQNDDYHEWHWPCLSLSHM